jgi:hypothetical protein
MVFLTVLSGLLDPGSERQWKRWQEEYRIEGGDGVSPHHYYRAMAWHWEEGESSEQTDVLPFAPRCRNDVIEEGSFFMRHHLLSSLEIVFFGPTSFCFEGEGGQHLGERRCTSIIGWI